MIKEDYNEPLIREDLESLQENASVAGDVVYSIVDYQDGNKLRWIRQAMAKRFAVRYIKKKDAKGEQQTYQVKDDKAVRMAIESGMFEVSSLGVFDKIIREVADLNRNTSFKFIDENGNENEDVSDKIREIREDANFDLSIGRLDELSVSCGSSAMLIQVLGNKMFYSPVSRNNIYVVYSDYVYDGERDALSQRSANRLDINEATAVIIDLGKEKHVAYFGRSLFYPQGRMVTYESSNWYSVPEVGTEDSNDYEIDGEIANPLTVYQDEKGDYSLPEYPVVTWYGSANAYGKELMPVDSSLYYDSLEQDVAVSRTLTAALKSARGAWHFGRDQGASDAIPANIDEGLSKLEPGQTVGLLHVPGQNIDTCMGVTEKLSAYMSESYGVPAYKLSVSQNAQVPSGAALIELNKPSALTRETRYKLNKSGMSLLFAIEKCLISIETGEDFADGIEQVWTVHPELVTKTKKELYEEAKLAKESGIKDDLENIIDTIDGIETREQAQEYKNSLEIKEAPSNGLSSFTQRVAQLNQTPREAEEENAT